MLYCFCKSVPYLVFIRAHVLTGIESCMCLPSLPFDMTRLGYILTRKWTSSEMNVVRNEQIQRSTCSTRVRRSESKGSKVEERSRTASSQMEKLWRTKTYQECKKIMSEVIVSLMTVSEVHVRYSVTRQFISQQTQHVHLTTGVLVIFKNICVHVFYKISNFPQ